MNSIFFSRTAALAVIFSPLLEAENIRIKNPEKFDKPSITWGESTQDPTSSNKGGPATVKLAYTTTDGEYWPSYFNDEQKPNSTTVTASASPASKLSQRDSSVGDTHSHDGPESFDFSVTLTYTDPTENGGGAQASSTETKKVDIQFVGRGGGNRDHRGDGSVIDVAGNAPNGTGGGTGGDGGGYHDCETPFIPGTLTPNEIVDARIPLALAPPTSLELVSENIAAAGYKYGYDTYITTTPPKRFSRKMVSTLLVGGDQETPVRGTFTEICNPPDGQEVRIIQAGNPSYYGTPAGGARTEVTLSHTFPVDHYDDCPNNRDDTPAVMEVRENITVEYTTAALKTSVFDKAFDFKGEGYYLHETALAKLDVSKDELNVDYQKTKYKWRIPADTTAYPRPYKVTWFEVFTPEDTIPDDGVEPVKEYTTFTEEIPAGKSETAEHEIDPALVTPLKEGTWEVSLPVEVGVDNNRDGELDLNATSDKTTSEKPYRFWLNNDHDLFANDTYDDQQDHPWTTQSLDNSNSEIESQRDLDDLARLHLKVEGIQAALENSSMTLGIKWKTTISGQPKIRIFKAAEAGGGTKYLSHAVEAANQIVKERTALGVVEGSSVFDLPVSFWTSTSATSKKHLLFESIGEGKGELTLVFKKNGSVIGEAGSVFLELIDIRKMYERWKIADGASFPGPDLVTATPVTGVTSVTDPNGHPFQAAWDEDLKDKSYIACVHGWRKNYNGARSDEITMFKRLWHRGFKGRYAGYYWPTLTGSPVGAKFNHSEYRAWKCGAAFKDFIETQLPSGYRKCVIAHSLGNVMVGSALSQGLVFDRYALLNGAIPAQCFDPDLTLKQTAATQTLTTGLGWPANVSYDAWTGGDLSDDPSAALRALAYRSRVSTVGSTRLNNFYLAADTALNAWEANQWSAGDGVPGIDSKPVDGYEYDIGVRLNYDPIGFGDRALTDSHEAMAMANQSMTKAVGGEGRTAGAITGSLDMNGAGILFGDQHQAAFQFVPSKTWEFYRQLLSELAFSPKP